MITITEVDYMIKETYNNQVTRDKKNIIMSCFELLGK